MEQSTEIFVGIDVSKARNAIAVASAGATAKCALSAKWIRRSKACGA
jgi:hypothetical protein